MPRTRLLVSSAILAATCAAAFGVPGAVASQHLRVDFSFPDTLCGFTGVTELSGIDNFGAHPNGGTYDNGRLVQTFTADNGRAVKIDYSAGREVFSPLTPNGDGTFTQTLTGTGLDVLTKAVGGPVLEQGAGKIVLQLVEDADGNTLSVTPISISGPNPNLTGAPHCSVIGPYLGGA